MSLVIRGEGETAGLVPAARRAVLRVDPEQPVYNIETLESYLAESVSRRRFLLLLLGLFATLALVLAAVGIYGVMSFAVAQRGREMAIRMALGAHRGQAFGLVFRQGMATTAAGLVLGIGGALALVRLLSSQLYAVRPSDPVTFTLSVAVFALVAALATYLPARRAARVDPVVAMREE